MKLKPTKPSPEMILAAREATGLSQMDAARAAGYGRYQTWAEFERGARLIDDVRWQWFLLQFGLHPKLKMEVR